MASPTPRWHPNNQNPKIPPADIITPPTTLRFVVLQHDHPMLHWDLLLEHGDACRTWRLLTEPSCWPIDAESIGNHRKHYLTYEGPVSGNRGTVSQWDAGMYELTSQTEFRWVVTFSGARLSGRYVLEKATSGDNWRGTAAAIPDV